MIALEASHEGLSEECEAPSDVLVVEVATGGSERYVLEAFESCKPKAMMLIAFPHKNSLAAALEAAAALPKGGIFFVRNQDDKSVIIKIAKRLDKFFGSNVVAIGKRAPWLVAPGFGEEDLQRIFGITITRVSASDVASEMESIKEEEVKELMESITVGARRVEVSEEDIKKAAKLHLALSRLVRGNKALLVNCFELMKETYVTPCLSVALFNAANVPAACEGDANSLLSQILTYAAYGSTGGIFNLDYVEGKRVAFAHCTAPLTLIDYYDLTYHYETGLPLGLRGYVEEGKDIISVRVSKEGYEVIKGKVVKGPRLDACATQVWAELEEPPRLPGNHRVLVGAKDADLLVQLIRSLGLHKA